MNPFVLIVVFASISAAQRFNGMPFGPQSAGVRARLQLNETCETDSQCEGMVYSPKTGYLNIVCKAVAGGNKICTCPEGFDHKPSPGTNFGACIIQGYTKPTVGCSIGKAAIAPCLDGKCPTGYDCENNMCCGVPMAPPPPAIRRQGGSNAWFRG